VLAASLDRLLSTVPDHAVVLDIGGWGKTLPRANWVLDLMPYETRGYYGNEGGGDERFTRDTWIQRDICSREPYPFADKSIDFVVCSHTLEDIRDPLWVCSEINRIGKAGYIEVPSRLEEQSYGVQGPWVGWGHHHWVVDITDACVDFTFKHHIIHGRETDYFPNEFWAELTPEQKIQFLWWEGGFEYNEKIHIGPGEIDDYFQSFVAENLRQWSRPRRRPLVARAAARTRRAFGR
jgi:hypothetical protein